jgi:hypothetical protein
VRLDPLERAALTQRTLGVSAKDVRPENAGGAFPYSRECPWPTERTVIDEPMLRCTCSVRSATPGREHVDFVSGLHQALDLTLYEMARRVARGARVGRAEDRDALPQVRGSSPKAFTASAPCAVSSSPSTRK